MTEEQKAIIQLSKDLNKVLEMILGLSAKISARAELYAMQQDQIIKLKMRIEKLELFGIDKFEKAIRTASDKG